MPNELGPNPAVALSYERHATATSTAEKPTSPQSFQGASGQQAAARCRPQAADAQVGYLGHRGSHHGDRIWEPIHLSARR